MFIIKSVPDRTKVSKEVWDKYMYNLKNYKPTEQNKINHRSHRRVR